jgi:hypothetical protein
MEAWIAQIRFDPAVEAKIREKHQLTAARVREAVALGAADRVDWHFDPVYGRRLIATGTDADGHGIVVYLRPLDQDEETWECLTAMMEG